MQDHAPTPRANGLGFDTSLSASARLAHRWRATGEPRHNVIAQQKFCSPKANDCAIIKHDHADVLNRLSAPPPLAVAAGDSSMPVPLETAGRELMRVGVEQSAEAFRSAFVLQPDAASSLRRFLGHERVL